MPEQRGEQREQKVKLVDSRGPTSVFIEAEIDSEGNLVISGQDLGEAPQRCFGDSDYEYWLVVAAADKERLRSVLLGQVAGSEQFEPADNATQDQRDRALLALVEKLYRGNLQVISTLFELLKAHGIKYTFSTY